MNHPRTGMPSRFFLPLAAAFFCVMMPVVARADADADWKKITEMDAGPQSEAKTRDEALKLTLAHLAAQEKALRAYITDYPGDAHGVEARMRLSHILSIQSDLEGKEELYDTALKILEDMLASPALPPEKKADVSFARLTLFMHRVQNPGVKEREALLSQVMEFKKEYPSDSRNGEILAEIASAYDDDPDKKRDLLTEAQRYASTPELKARISDDFKRLGLLGRPLDIKFSSVQGDQVDMADYRGKVVLIYFFSGFSTPSIIGLQPVRDIAEELPKNQFQLIGISLDEKKETVLAIINKMGLKCPVYFDAAGKGWDSALPRSLGINELPTVWLVDKKGRLRVLNAVNNTEDLVKVLIQEN